MACVKRDFFHFWFENRFNRSIDLIKNQIMWNKKIYSSTTHTLTQTQNKIVKIRQKSSHVIRLFFFWLNVIHLHTHTKPDQFFLYRMLSWYLKMNHCHFQKFRPLCVCVHIIFRVRYQLYECFTWLFYLIMYWPLVVFISFEFSRTRNPYSSFSLFSIQKCMIWISLLSWWWWWD